MPSVSDPGRHGSQGRPGLPSESVWIESIGGGRVGGGWGGWWGRVGSHRWGKANIQTQRAVLCHQ